MRPIDEWDEPYVLSDVIEADESESFERKASDALEDDRSIAKEICAFANAGDGIIVYGLKDKKRGGGLDGGLSENRGREPVASWLQAKIPKLHHPPITNCSIQFVALPSVLPAGQGILAVSVVLGERRPHWTQDGEKPYLRVGEHSAPMRLQTLLDINSRGAAPAAEIGEVKFLTTSSLELPPDQAAYYVGPTIRVASGPVCRVWGIEFALTSKASGDVLLPPRGDVATAVATDGDVRWFAEGAETLFPRRWVKPSSVPTVSLCHADFYRKVRVSLFLESALPVHRTWRALYTADRAHPFRFELIEDSGLPVV
jgi:hypothetical protein